MAITSLNDSQSCANFFRDSVLINLQYWQGCDGIWAMNVEAFDQEWEGIIRAISFALNIDEVWPTVRSLIEALPSYMERRGYWEPWYQVLTRAMDMARHVEDLEGATALSLMLARLHQRRRQFKVMVARYRQTVRLARQTGDKNSEARACSNLGYFYVEQGHWYRAEVLCCHALTIFEEMDNAHGRAHTENHLGTLYLRQRRWEMARQYLEQACAIWQSMGSMGDEHGLMRGYINMGMLYVYMEYPGKALPYLEKALSLAKLTKEVLEVARIYNNMAIAHRLSGEPAKAETHAWQAEKIFRQYSNAAGLAEVYDNLGLACLDQEKWQDAQSHLEAALHSWRKLANRLGEIRVLTYLVDYELVRGNQQKAAERFYELEHLITQEGGVKQYHFLQPRLEKYRRSLTEYSTR